MNYSKAIRMTQPLPNPTDWTAMGEWLISVGGLLIAFFGFTGKYFKDKADAREKFAAAQKQERQDFIEKVVIATVSATLNSTLGGIKDDIATLFKYREEDKKDMNNRFDRVMIELKK